MSGSKFVTPILLMLAVVIGALWLGCWPEREERNATSIVAPAASERSQTPRHEGRAMDPEDPPRTAAGIEQGSHYAVRDVEVRVTDESGAPLARGTLRILGRDIDRRGRSGSVEFLFTDVPLGSLEVLAEGFLDAYDASETHEIVRGDDAQRLEVRLRRVVRIPVLLRTPQGERLRDRIAHGFPGFPRMPVVLADREPFGRRIAERAPAEREPWRAGRILPPRDKEHDGVLECLSPPPLHVALVLGDSVLARPIHEDLLRPRKAPACPRCSDAFGPQRPHRSLPGESAAAPCQAVAFAVSLRYS